MVRPGLAFFALTFGLFKAGAVPILVDPGLGIRNIGPALAEASPTAFIGIPAAQLARRLFGWGKHSIRFNSALTITSKWHGSWLDPMWHSLSDPFGWSDDFDARLPDDTAAILFTSGSTGVPKGAVYTHAIFRAQVESLRRTYDILPGEVDLCTFPLFALFGPTLG